MGLISSLGLGGPSAPKIQNIGFDRWKKQGKIGLDKTIDRSGMTYSDRKKIKGIIHPKLAGGRKLSHDQIIKEIKKEGYDLGNRVQKALTPKIKAGSQKPSLDEQAVMLKKSEKKKKVNIFLGLKSSKEANKYKKTKGAMGAGMGFGWQAGEKQPTEQDKGQELGKSAFQGIGSSVNKPNAAPPDTAPKTPPPPIPLSHNA